jgi:DNA-binding NarL/FixJ family response regulator
MKPLKILLVDDHTVVREGVRRLIASMQDIVLSEASSGAEALAIAGKEPPDLVLLDLNMQGISGLELLRRLLLKDPKARVIVFSMHAEPIYAARALRLGAKGYVSKSAAADELITAIKRVSEGGHYIEQELASQLAISQFAGDDPLQQLTTREVEILRLLGEGKSLSAIAEALGVSYKTVANSCSLMKSKLGVERTADLIRTSIELLKN